MDPKAIIKRGQKALQDRRRFEPMFDDALRLTMPGRRRFNDSNVNERGDDIFDETGANAVAEFVSRIQAGLMPAFTPFMRLEADSSVDKKDRDAVNKDLADIREFAFEEIWKSNFAQEVSEALFDMSISMGVLNVEDGGARGALVHRAVPITELAVERGPDDAVGGVFRYTSVPQELLESRYPKAKIPEGGKLQSILRSGRDEPLEVVEYTRHSFKEAHKSEHFVVVVDAEETIVEQTMTGRGCHPFLPFRWQTTAGENWGRGPLLNALGAVRTTNLMVELILENAAMSIVGIYQTDNEGTLNADQISLLPGTILHKEIGTNGLEPVAGNTGNFNMQDVVLGDQRLNIKRALFNDMLSDPNKTPATATEVVERMADLANRTSAGFSRLFYELLAPYMRRVLYILEKRGDIELPTIKGKGIGFHAVSPIAQAQYSREIQTLVQGHQVRAMVYGPQAAAAAYNMDHLHAWMIEREGLDPRLYASADDVKKAMAETAAAAAQMQAMGAKGSQQ